LNEIDLVVSFDGADKQLNPPPPHTKVERWSIPAAPSSSTAGLAALTQYRNERDEINKRVFALSMDHWRNVA
jgi:hypothetical protein